MYRVYCDFDATVTEHDVWHQLFDRFGTPAAFTIWKEFGRGKMTAAECIRFACSTVENANVEAMIAMFRSQPLRAGFKEFTAYCNAEAIDVRIVSDGFTGYIRPILEVHGLSQLPYHANTIEPSADGTLSVRFENGRESCRFCAACKCGDIITTSGDDDTIVYVGDGYSDVCPVEIADVVFARDTLLGSCSSRGIPHHPFTDFHGVMAILNKYVAERPHYRREQARRARKKLIVAE